ncbi:DNA (cytosine-5)-methyltransferase 1 [Nocardiopsis mwathae]|uniref:DNA (cytosine-5-)-methyltransferase n=1 Tax=Nocardiopsis mwathae TaxID=1472723 RepID=A0A7W9YHE1_9ACTN|nr:DNA cytosine methyltransferase [Nocardiopsis mwathae]MBB6172194.1 DNA (cytosine-5)-methyltransferase 1 [Nocardiopsis mwathae]
MNQPAQPPLIGSLCTGYGGLDMAAEQVYGARTAWVADPAPGPAAILAHNYPAPNLGDLHSIDWANTPPVDIITAGFPCQPVSLSGRRGGIDDERWIFDFILNGIQQLPQRPRRLVFENVRGLFTANQGEAMRRVVHGLAEHGFLPRWRVLRASDAGAPHQRPRVFVVAVDALRLGERVGPPRAGDESEGKPGVGDTPDPVPAGSLSGEGVHDPDLWGRFHTPIRRWEQVVGRPAPYPAEQGPRTPRLSMRWLEWFMGLPEGWVTGVPGLSYSAQRHALGNGVVPQQAAAALADLEAWPDPAR